MTLINDGEIQLDEEGFLLDPTEWDESLGRVLAANIGLELSEAHFAAIRFARDDQAVTGETPTLRRMATVGGVSTKEMFALFPQKPAKKMSYVAGLRKPVGCV